jgi:DNA-binding LacI/PurR family transcriptional regulator
MATTMREVAEAAGVSIATVSFVVNNSKRVAPGRLGDRVHHQRGAGG